MKYKIQKDDFVILLGAGASVDAKIPATSEMIRDLENLLESKWKPYKKLYDYIKKSIHGKNPINIEDLVSTLNELLLVMNGQHPLYPFMKSWIDLISSLEYNLEIVEDFIKDIYERLRYWVIPENYHAALEYYLELERLKMNFQNSLRIFTLNYDLCIEETIGKLMIERGFGNEKEKSNNWDYKRFSERDEEHNPVDIYLYKLHGSIDWKRDKKTDQLRWAKVSHIEPEEFQLIFGTRQKMQSYDPFLFFFYEFRQYCLNTKLIIVSGYSFGDEHVNKIIGQALRNDSNKRILINKYSNKSSDKEDIKNDLGLDNVDQINIVYGKAKKFFKENLKISEFEKLIPDVDEDLGLPN